MDFGLAKVVEEVRNHTTIVSGTPYYMSPEQTLGQERRPPHGHLLAGRDASSSWRPGRCPSARATSPTTTCTRRRPTRASSTPELPGPAVRDHRPLPRRRIPPTASRPPREILAELRAPRRRPEPLAPRPTRDALVTRVTRTSRRRPPRTRLVTGRVETLPASATVQARDRKGFPRFACRIGVTTPELRHSRLLSRALPTLGDASPRGGARCNAADHRGEDLVYRHRAPHRAPVQLDAASGACGHRHRLRADRSAAAGRDSRAARRASPRPGSPPRSGAATPPSATVEHLLAALYGLGIDNVRVEVDGPEVPVMDGSSASFVFLIRAAGIFEQRAPRPGCACCAPDRGPRRATGASASSPRASCASRYAVDFAHPAIGRQELRARPRSTASASSSEICRRAPSASCTRCEALWQRRPRARRQPRQHRGARRGRAC